MCLFIYLYFFDPPLSLTPAVKVEKIHVKMDYASSKPGHVPASSSSSSCSTVSSSPSKPGLNSQSVPKAHQASPGHIPNGKSHLSPLSKKQDSSTNASSKRPPRKVLGGFCGVGQMLVSLFIYPDVGMEGWR